jgi:chemotaxis protein MotB
VPEDHGGEGHRQGPIFKKVKKVMGAHHGGAWKVAYADLTTAMMAFFIVLWILSQSDQVTKSVAGYFRDPVGFTDGGQPSILEGENQETPSLMDIPVPKQTGYGSEGGEQEVLWRTRAQQIQIALERIPSFAAYQDQIELAITPEGLRISLIESHETPLFQVGSTDLNRDARKFLQTIAGEISELENHVILEGHTDSRPFVPDSDMNNWQLSSGRAHTAREVLEESGVDPARVFEVRGHADRQLYNPLDPEDSRNRRVSITLLSDEAHADRQEIGKTTILN